jgi:hypothetical protein
MVVFLPDYFTETCGDTNQTTLMLRLSRYFGGFLDQTAYAQQKKRIALLTYTTLRAQPMMISEGCNVRQGYGREVLRQGWLLVSKYGLISARSVVANPALNEPRSVFGRMPLQAPLLPT